MNKQKKVYVVEDLCTGCKMCQLICSYEHSQEFNPKKSKINVIHVDEQGIYIPIVDCDYDCKFNTENEVPKCVKFCNTGALIYSTSEEAAEMKRELVRKRVVQPLFKVIAPWKWPFPWKPWPFEGVNDNE